MSTSSKKSIVIVGGGTAATTLASDLEKSIHKLPGYEIVLITGKEYHYHLIAGLRANTSNADVAEKIVIPYDKLFKNKDISRIILKKASEVRRDRVVLEDGTEVPFTFCIVATGKQWMSPLDIPDSRAQAIEQMKAYRDRAAAAKNIVIVGGGAVGIEMAGELATTYSPSSGKKITLIHSQPKLVNKAYSDKFRNGLQQQLTDLGVNLILDDSVEGDFNFTTGPTTLRTRKGKVLSGVDLVIQATGGSVNTYVLEKLAPHLISKAGVSVKPTFQIEGHDNIFVMGDLTDLPEQKQAIKAAAHVAVVSANLQKLAKGESGSLATYKTQPEMAVINIGQQGGMGALTLPLIGSITIGPWASKTLKGKELFVSKARAAMGY